MVLAYVHWHWPRAGVELDRYEDAQRAFHAALAAEPPVGFRGSTCHRLTGASWAANGGTAYEDWYFQDDSAALDRLNDAAVAAGRKAAHDQAAALFGGGTAGLYLLKVGEPGSPAVVACWFGKPDGWSYPRLVDAAAGALSGGTLWQRRMTLGPAPEFCLRATGPISVPEGIATRLITLSPVWPA